MTSTTIRINKDTRKKLNDLGKKADTYDDILCRILDYIEEKGITWEELNGVRKRKKP